MTIRNGEEYETPEDEVAKHEREIAEGHEIERRKR